jgi:hypothetical protein
VSYKRKEIIGECVEVTGLSHPLSPHMTRLAKPYQVFPIVGSGMAIKVTKWCNVMDWKRLSDMFSAMSATTILFANNLFPRLKPPFPAIGGYTPNVTRGFFRHKHTGMFKAPPRTEFSQPILANEPRLLCERPLAMLACSLNTILPIMAFVTSKPFREGISRTLPCAESIADKVRLVPYVEKFSSQKSPLALRRAKAGFLGAVWLDLVGRVTFLANEIYQHISYITYYCSMSMGSGTTLVACARMGRKGIGIELEPKYFDIACKRVEEAYKQGSLFIPAPKPEQTELILSAPAPHPQT